MPRRYVNENRFIHYNEIDATIDFPNITSWKINEIVREANDLPIGRPIAKKQPIAKPSFAIKKINGIPPLRQRMGIRVK